MKNNVEKAIIFVFILKSMLFGASWRETTFLDFSDGDTSHIKILTPDPDGSDDGALWLPPGRDTIYVLQVYPPGHNTTLVAQAMQTYGPLGSPPLRFKLFVIPLSNFNSLTSESSAVMALDPLTGEVANLPLYFFDVLYFGVADCYGDCGGNDLTPTSAQVVRRFAMLGKGVILTHDTIGGTPSSLIHPNFNSLSDISGLLGGAGAIYSFTFVKRVTSYRTDPVLNTPFVIPDTFSVLNCHTPGSLSPVAGTIWYKGTDRTLIPDYGIYWHTYHNTTYNSYCGFYSYGHTEATPLEWEAKSMINTIFYSYFGGIAQGVYTSSIKDLGCLARLTRVLWSADVPSNCSLYVEIRIDTSRTGSPSWTSWYRVPYSGATDPLGGLYGTRTQWRAGFSRYAGASPASRIILHWIQIDYECYREPSIDAVWFSEETICNDSNIVRICYDLSGDTAYILAEISADSGRSWNVPLISLRDTAGDLGANVAPGRHCFDWIMSRDFPGAEQRGFLCRITAIDTVFSLGDTNLLRNGGIETPFNPSTDWTTHGTTTRSSFSHSGASSFYVNTDCYAQYIYQRWPLVENQSYFFECFVYLESNYFRSMTVEIVRDWNPSTGYALTASAISFHTIDSLTFTIWGGRSVTINDAHLTPGMWHRIGIFADVLHGRQTLYIDGIPAVIITSDTSYTAQWIIAGTVAGSCDNYARIYLDDFFLTYYDVSPYEHSSVAIAPLDSRPPVVNLFCPDSALTPGSITLRWSVRDTFWRGEPSSLRFSCCTVREAYENRDTIFVWRPPVLDCPSCTLIVAVRDSFCNWGYDSCVFRLIRAMPELSVRVVSDSLVCLPGGRIAPDPMNVLGIVSNSGRGSADSVGVFVRFDSCFTMLSGANPQILRDIAPGETDTVRWQFRVSRACEGRSSCIALELIHFR